MKDLTLFQGSGITDGKDQYATRNQIENLYDVPAMTRSDNVKKLKEDRLVNGTKIRMVAKDGKQRRQEGFDLKEVIAMGVRLPSDTAIRLQRYAANLLVEKMQTMVQERRTLELELSYAWNRSDNEDLYR